MAILHLPATMLRARMFWRISRATARFLGRISHGCCNMANIISTLCILQFPKCSHYLLKNGASPWCNRVRMLEFIFTSRAQLRTTIAVREHHHPAESELLRKHCGAVITNVPPFGNVHQPRCPSIHGNGKLSINQERKRRSKNCTKRQNTLFVAMSYLCLGPMSAGKTLLLTCLQKPDSVNFTSHSVPSVGTNLYTIKIPPIVIDEKDVNQKIPPPGKRKELVQVREVGGCLAPIWRDYLLNPVDKLIYVVDTSNLCQISAAGKTGLC